MKKLFMACAVALATVSTANAFTQDQQREMDLVKIQATCLNPVTNQKLIYTGTNRSIYISESSGLLVIRLPSRVITLAPHYCLIEGYKQG